MEKTLHVDLIVIASVFEALQVVDGVPRLVWGNYLAGETVGLRIMCGSVYLRLPQVMNWSTDLGRRANS